MTDPNTEDAPGRPTPFDPEAPVETVSYPSLGGIDEANPDGPQPAAGDLIDPALPADPAYHGPYIGADFGYVAAEGGIGEPVNAYGRSASMNDPARVAAEIAEIEALHATDGE